jgi:hypothetical protein
LYHFDKNRIGVYSGSFTRDNIVAKLDNGYRIIEYSATLDGEVIKVVGINRDPKEDSYLVEKEFIFYTTVEFENWYKENNLNGQYIVDCSNNNMLSSLINNYNIPFVIFDDKDKIKSIQVIKQGFYNNKIKIYRECNNTIKDIKKLKLDENSRINGIDKLETQNEGFAKCVRGFVIYYRGISSIWC